MLASAEQVKQAMSLDRWGILDALKRSGYTLPPAEVLEAKFKGFSGSQFVYEILYPNPQDEGNATGHLYVTLKRQAFSSKFECYAEY